MPQPPYQIQPDTKYPEIIARINENFTNAVADIGDLGGFTNWATASTGALTLAAGASVTFRVNLSSTLPIFADGSSIAMPLVDIYVDVDNTAASLLHGASSTLTSAQKALTFGAYVSRTRVSSNTWQYIFCIRNNDSGSHDYYVYASGGAIPAVNTSQFR